MTLRAAVVGMGSAGRRHLGNLLHLGVRDVTAVSEHNRLASLTIDGTDVAVAHDYEQVLADDGINVIVIANPTSFHLDYTARAIAANKHVYLEKPVAASAEGLAGLCDEADRRGRVVAVGTQNRFNARLDEMRARLATGDAGTLIGVRAMLGEHIADYHPGEDFRQSYTARSDLGGGVLLTQVHQIDYLNWLFGPFDTAFAVGGQRSTLEIDVEDCVSYMLRSKDGIGVQGHLDYLQRPKRVDLEVIGTTGRFEWDYFRHTLTYLPATANGVAETTATPFERNDMFVACMANFLSCVKNGGTPRAALRDGMAALRIIDAIRQSMTTGQAIGIET